MLNLFAIRHVKAKVMKIKASILTTLSVTISLFFSINTYSQDFYDINTVNTIDINFSQSNWDEILDSLFEAGYEERLVGSVVINGVQFDSVGVRYKGNSSYNPNRIKNSLNIKLDHIIEDQELDGYGTLKLANVFKDPSFVRETLSYEIAGKYMPATKANFINVFINGDLIGFYTSVQSVDKFFLGNHFYSNDFVFFKGELIPGPPPQGCPVGPPQIWGYLGEDELCYYNFYEMRSDSGWDELIGFLDILNNNTSLIEDVLNVDRHLWMLAYDNLMVNLDAPINFGHNYYLYKDGTGRFNPIMWDMNENFGAFSMLLGGGGPLNLTQMQQLDPLLNISHPGFPIINKILPYPTFQKIYIAHMKTILEENFINGLYETRALEIQSIIDPYVQADPNKLYTYSDFLSNVYNSVGGGQQVIVGITQLMEARVNYLNNHPLFQYSAPVITNITYTPTPVSYNSEVWIIAEVSNANIVKLAFRFLQTSKFEKIEMYDDGNHNDGAAGDGVYGVLITVGSTDVQYYIYAENSDAVKFSPERAEYEFYTIEVSGDLVINEFMADNETVVPDPEGEYDDWIEFYNNSNNTISLNGYYLSDESSDLTKWAFPDTSIAVGEYLIVWADDDEGQPGLHANFKLSKSGEEIVLVAPDTTIVDEVVFGPQPTDLSTGRYPNRTGSFVLMNPTFAAENTPGITVVIDGNIIAKDFGLMNYPNPFNPTTKIKYTIGSTVQTQNFVSLHLAVFDINGEKIATLINQKQPPGKYEVEFDGSGLPAGIYYFRLTVGKYLQTKKMVLVR